MSFNRLFREAEVVSDHLVTVAGGELTQNLDFALTQCIFRTMFDQLDSNFGGHSFSARVYGANAGLVTTAMHL